MLDAPTRRSHSQINVFPVMLRVLSGSAIENHFFMSGSSCVWCPHQPEPLTITGELYLVPRTGLEYHSEPLTTGHLILVVT